MTIRHIVLSGALLVFSSMVSFGAQGHELRIELALPTLDVSPYHKPYLAIWLETTDRKPIATVALWVEKDTWFKDLRQWWRKIGRANPARLDGVTGATRSPGRYRIVWDAKDADGVSLAAGDYLLNIEASREEGGRSYSRETITLGGNTTIHIPSHGELGDISITTE